MYLWVNPITCNAHPIAIRLHDYCAMCAPPPPTPLLYPIQHIILAMAISYIGQVIYSVYGCLGKISRHISSSLFRSFRAAACTCSRPRRRHPKNHSTRYCYYQHRLVYSKRTVARNGSRILSNNRAIVLPRWRGE